MDRYVYMEGFMNSRLPKIALFIPVLLLMFIIGIYCGKDGTNPEPDPAFSLLSYSDCKVFAAKQAIPGIPEETCLEYNCDGTGILYIKHINASFNCCIDSISATQSLEGNVISINETEHLMGGGCDCICYYDIEYRLDDIAPGIYNVEISPNSTGNDPSTVYTIDISEAVVDTVCIPIGTIFE